MSLSKKPAMADLVQFYGAQVKPFVDAIEKKRKALDSAVLTIALLAGGFAYFREKNIPHFAPQFKPWSLALAVGGAIVAGGFLIKFLHVRSAGFRREFKRKIVAGLVEAFYPHLNYSPEAFISPESFNESSLFTQEFNEYEGEDYFAGKHGNANFQYSELFVRRVETRYTSRGARRQVVEIFNGLFFSADYEKNFFDRTIIKPDSLEGALGVMGRGMQRIAYGERLVDLEDPEFEEMFVVTADNQVEARRILTPAFMERIKNLRKKLGCMVYLSFVNSRIFVAIPLKEDLFEPHVIGSLCSLKDIAHFVECIQTAVGLTEDLDIGGQARENKQG